jgi:hypothetical protein
LQQKFPWQKFLGHIQHILQLRKTVKSIGKASFKSKFPGLTPHVIIIFIFSDSVNVRITMVEMCEIQGRQTGASFSASQTGDPAIPCTLRHVSIKDCMEQCDHIFLGNRLQHQMHIVHCLNACSYLLAYFPSHKHYGGA